MDQTQINVLLDDLVSKHGLEPVIAGLAQAAVNQAERMSGMGHEGPAQEALAIAETLTGIVEVVESEGT